MSNQDINQTELEALRTQADLLGVKYHPSISAEKLREKITAHLAATEEKEDKPKAAAGKAVIVEESENDRRKRLREEAARLVRIRLTCMNPAKKDWEGEIFTVGNTEVGTFKRYVPFNAENGWHVENIIYQMLKDRMCQVFYTEKSRNGVAIRKGKLIKEFAIEVLPPLTPEELHDLAQQQAMANRIG